MIQANIQAPCTVLDFPNREDFARELRENHYDVVGISSIIVNVGKVREMCRMVRELSPGSQVVVGGHVAAIPGIEKMIDADHIVRGDGVSWMRRYLGEDEAAPIHHPHIVSGFNTRIMGLKVPKRRGATAATLIPSVGCPMGCNFCTTSAFFGGKGKFLNFFDTGRELFDIMSELESALAVKSFFIMDENFLLHRKRAMELLALIEENHKSWELYVFSSANAIKKYTMEELVRLGISWVWMGLESPKSSYQKLAGSDTLELTRNLREHGIKVLGSTIVGLEHHTPTNISDEIEHAISHDTDFHQFMLYTPVPGTPLFAEMNEQGRMIDVNLADIHGQFKFNFEHAAISRDDSKRFLDFAFLRDFERNGPSVYRIAKTMFAGCKRYRFHSDLRIRERFEREARMLNTIYSGVLWAMEKYLRKSNEAVSRNIATLRREIRAEFGALPTVFSRLLGPYLLWSARRETRRLAAGVTYEPPTFIERTNWV